MSQIPLVSVVVITYNSEDFIIETLESIKKQTYKNIELIISDDCSKDNTLDLCYNWISLNNDRFENTKIITVEFNTGIPANCNRGVIAANGEWIKIIAGDDLLIEDCINSYVTFTLKNTEADIIAGNMQYFIKDNNVNKKLHIALLNIHKKFFTLSAKKQNKTFLTDSFNIAPTVFIRKKILEMFDYFDEKYKYFEDLPMWLRITDAGYKIFYLDKIVVLYRTDHESMNNNKTFYFNKLFMDSYFDFKQNYVFNKVPFYNFLFYQSFFIEKIHYNIIIYFFKNKRNSTTKIFTKFFMLLDIKRYYNKIKRIAQS